MHQQHAAQGIAEEQPIRELTRAGRLSAMLIVAAVAVPCAALAGMLVLRRYVLVHYDTHGLILWLVLDAALLSAGLILREGDDLRRAKERHQQEHIRPLFSGQHRVPRRSTARPRIPR